MKFKKNIICFIIITIAFTGCNKRALEFERLANHTDLVEESEYGKIMMEFSKLDGEDIRSFSTKKGKTYEFQYTYLVTEGTLEVQFRDSQDNIITNISLSEDEYNKEIERLKNDNDGHVELYDFGATISVKSKDKKIKIAFIGKEAKGKINITW